MNALYFALTIPDREAIRFLEDEERARRGYTREAKTILEQTRSHLQRVDHPIVRERLRQQEHLIRVCVGKKDVILGCPLLTLLQLLRAR